MDYNASADRYAAMDYRRSGRSGLLLPAISLGLWHNFGAGADFGNCERMMFTAFDNGITYFDLANNYGPPPGSAEVTFGRIFKGSLRPYRDEMVVATKAGYTMWDGPYGDWGSRKYLVASLDRSLERMGLDYVDIFYHHRFDPETPLEETMSALDHIVRSGKALYAALSNYPADKFCEAVAILRRLGTPCVAHQIRYSMLVRDRGESLFGLHRREGVGCVSFSPLAQGVLSDRYLEGIPQDSRAARGAFLKEGYVNENIDKVRRLSAIARRRGQTMSQMSIAWQLNDDRVTTVLTGASSPQQIVDNIGALAATSFTSEELQEIDGILTE